MNGRAVRYADATYPGDNPIFRPYWAEPPPLKRERPRIAETIQGARNSFDGSSTNKNSDTARLIQWANCLDRIADAELFLGHHSRAEYLAHRAAEMRAEVAA
jgi:hypothetical protein